MSAIQIIPVCRAEDANTYQQLVLSQDEDKLSSFAATKRMKEDPANPFNIILSMHLMKKESDYNEARIQTFEVASAFYMTWPGSEPANNFQNQTIFLRKYMENNAFL